MKACEHGRWFLALAVTACLVWTGAAGAQEGGGLGEIVKRLGSEEYAVRERAQAELAKVPREQLETLKEAANGAKDAEVKARLEARISEIEADVLLHPPKLSVDLKNASWADVRAALNQQLGGAYIEAGSGGRGAPRRVTLEAQNQPLWEILRQLNEQVPMVFSVPEEWTPREHNLQPSVSGMRPQPFHVVDDVCIVLMFEGRPATGDWSIGLKIFTDPRVRIARYQSALQVDKVIDKDGQTLVALPADSAMEERTIMLRPTAYCTATFAAAPGVKFIKELRGSAAVEVVESEDIVKIDLTKELTEPVVTALGRFTLEKALNGDYTLKLEPAAAASDKMPVMRVLDSQGVTIQEHGSSEGLSRKIFGSNRVGKSAMLEIILSRKTREARLPVVLKDFEVPANPRVRMSW